MKEKVVLAYSGGLDTTALIPWLKETFDYDVVCCCVNCGQGNELDGLEERAKMSGASKLYIEDIVDEFCDDFIMPCVQAGAVYEHSNIFSELPWLVRLSPRNWLRSHVKKALLQSATVLQVKEMTRSVSNLVSKLLLRTSKSSLHGV